MATIGSSSGRLVGGVVTILVGMALAMAAAPAVPTATRPASLPASMAVVIDPARAEARLQALLSVVNDPEPEVRCAAIRALGRAGDKRILAHLAGALSHYDDSVRSCGLEAIAQFDDPGVRKLLLAALKDADARVAAVAAEGLLKHSKNEAEAAVIRRLQEDAGAADMLESFRAGKVVGVPVLVEAMNGSGRQRQAAADALAAANSKEAVEALAKALANDDWRIRQAAADALRDVTRQPVAALAKACRDPSSAVRLAAVQSLGKSETTYRPRSYRRPARPESGRYQASDEAIKALTDVLSDPEPELRRAALEAILAVGGSRKLGGLLIVMTGDPDEQVRSVAATCLGGFAGMEQLPDLKRLALGDDPFLAQRAAEAIAMQQDKAAFEAQAWLMSDDFAAKYHGSAESLSEVRENVLGAMGGAEDPKAVAVLAAACGSKDDELRSRAAESLSSLVAAGAYHGDKEIAKAALEVLRPMARDTVPKIREGALSAVADADGAKAVPVLLAAVEDEEPDVREMAIERLGRLKAEKAVEAIAKALAAAKDADMEVPVRALALIGNRPATKALAENLDRMGRKLGDDLRLQILEAREIDPALYGFVESSLSSKEYMIQQAAVKAMGKTDDKRAVEPLAKLAENEDSTVREDAVFALARLDEERAMKPYLAMLEKMEAGREPSFTKAITATGEKGLASALIALLAHDKGGIRHGAANALARIGGTKACKALVDVYYSDKFSVDRVSLREMLRQAGVEVPVLPRRTTSAPTTSTAPARS